MKSRMQQLALTGSMLLLAGACLDLQVAQAQTWPSQSVKIVVPYGTGGTADISARVLAPELSKIWGQPVTVENKPGADTQTGTDLVAKSNDKHTLLITAAPFAINQALFASLPYDSSKDFIPITIVVRSGLILTTGPASGIRTMADVLSMGKQSTPLTFANPGNGTMGHMSAEMLASMKQLNIKNLPYRGTGPALPDLMGNKVQLMFNTPSSVLPLISDGKLVALAYTDRKRSSALPKVPTVSQSDVEGFETINWFGMLAPSTVGQNVATKIYTDVATVLRRREIIERFAKEGVEVGGIPREAFSAYLVIETVKWKKIVQQRSIKPEASR